MFKLLSSDVTTHAIIDILQPMAATTGEFIRHDALCKVAVTHARNFLGVLLIDGKGNSYVPNDHERQLVLDHYKPKSLQRYDGEPCYLIQKKLDSGQWEDIFVMEKFGEPSLKQIKLILKRFRATHPGNYYRLIEK